MWWWTAGRYFYWWSVSTRRIRLIIYCSGQLIQARRSRPHTLSPVHTCDKVDVAETGNKSATKSTIADTVDFVAGFGDKSATAWIGQLVAVDIVANSIDFVANTVDFVASVYRALEIDVNRRQL